MNQIYVLKLQLEGDHLCWFPYSETALRDIDAHLREFYGDRYRCIASPDSGILGHIDDMTLTVSMHETEPLSLTWLQRIVAKTIFNYRGDNLEMYLVSILPPMTVYEDAPAAKRWLTRLLYSLAALRILVRAGRLIPTLSEPAEQSWERIKANATGNQHDRFALLYQAFALSNATLPDLSEAL